MGKKRKLTASSTTTSASPSTSASTPRIRVDLKEEASVSGISSDLLSARDRLRGALQDLLEQSGDDESAGSGGEDHEAGEGAAAVRPPALIKKEPAASAAGSSTVMKTVRQQQRRRRRREMMSEGAFHHTYVMKLFDRSVDLAQFKEDTPLYPVCRAWIANQPHNTDLVPKMRTPTPEPPPDEEPSAMDTSGSGDDADLVRDTYKMPPPLPLPEDETERRRLRIPSPILPERGEIELDYDVKPPVPKEILLQEHLGHWAAVRKKWHDTMNKNGARYDDSAQILRAIYRKAQKAFE